MTSNASVVDILLATYNGEENIREQIESIRYQTYENWRLLISDDCSSDATLSIVREYAKNDSRVQVVSDSHRFGNSRDNFLNLIRYSSSPYAMFCDQDDVWFDDKIEVSLQAIEDGLRSVGQRGVSEEYPALVFTDSVIVNNDLEVIAPSFMQYMSLAPNRHEFKHMICTNTAAGNTMMLNRALVVMLQQIDNCDKFVMHDWLAMLVASAFGSIFYLSRPTLMYRQHQDNVVGAYEYTVVRQVRNRLRPSDDIRIVKRLRDEANDARQAEAFLELFADRLSDEQANRLTEFIKAIDSTHFVPGIVHLVRSGCWKNGVAKKVGQILHRMEYARSTDEQRAVILGQ